MNVNRILILAHLLDMSVKKRAQPKLGFDMMAFAPRPTGGLSNIEDLTGHNCGTACCIGGWAHYAFADYPHSQRPTSEVSGALLGLSHEQYWKLFFDFQAAPHDRNGKTHITPRDGARVLRNLARTGKVDWSILNRKPRSRAHVSK